MTTCWSCGLDTDPDHACPHCGRSPAADWHTDTAERPAVPADQPADQPAGQSADVRVDVQQAAYRHRGRRPWVPLVAALAGATALGLVGAAGLWLLTADRTNRAVDSSITSPASTGDSASSAAGTASPSPEADRPSAPPTGDNSGEPSPSPSKKPADLARLATAVVPATAEPNQDLSGNLVRYEARNMLDGVPETCWRMPGDAAGAEIVFRLDEPTTLSSVGLVNGYAKSATDAAGRTLDWYHGNRRVLRVQWTFDDGSTLDQTLGDTMAMQRLRVPSVTTETVRLRLVTVSAPGAGPAARNYTSISDVALVGRPHRA